jgi:hypothetical protein
LNIIYKILFLFILSNLLFSREKEILLLTYNLPEEIVVWYDRNYQDPNAEGSWKLCNVFKQPDSTAEITGEIWVKYDKAMKWFSAIFKPKSSGNFLIWNEDIGDFGYGITEFVIESRNGFVKLTGKIFSGDAWIKLIFNDGINGEVRSIIGGLYYMPEVKAADLSNKKEIRLTNEVYYIISKDETGYIIRKELPGDMPCGEETKENIDESKIPKYKVKFEDFFDNDERVIISLAYPKGC